MRKKKQILKEIKILLLRHLFFEKNFKREFLKQQLRLSLTYKSNIIFLPDQNLHTQLNTSFIHIYGNIYTALTVYRKQEKNLITE